MGMGWGWGMDTSVGMGTARNMGTGHGDGKGAWEPGRGTGHGHRARARGTGRGHRAQKAPSLPLRLPAGCCRNPSRGGPREPTLEADVHGAPTNTSTILPARCRPAGDSGKAPGTKLGRCWHPEHPAATLGTEGHPAHCCPHSVSRGLGDAWAHGDSLVAEHRVPGGWHHLVFPAVPLGPPNPTTCPLRPHQRGAGGQDPGPDALTWLCGIAEGSSPPARTRSPPHPWCLLPERHAGMGGADPGALEP